ncbi:MAG TPA: PIN domain-containing protein [Candidatus Methanomethylicus sp.]|jgi:rRNA-processing protein FCF1|nr:PIN domain-containing protein [Candidatus Methanomethylicus sp.]HRU81269.1 PIN domain-containing protein [Candidatus Methanomethylicus sp.]
MASSSSPKGPLLTVILDTNILIYSASQPFDIAHSLEQRSLNSVLVPSFVIAELECLARGSRKRSKVAALALRIASQFKAIQASVDGRTVDDKLANLAAREGYIVATADSPLRRRLLAMDVPVIYLKDGRLITEHVPLE